MRSSLVLMFLLACTPSTAKPAAEEDLRARLTPLQFEVTQHAATEPPFRNAYWDNHADGIYVDVVSGEPLFSSRDKFDSGTGWPSFSRPIETNVLKESSDLTLGMERTEVIAKRSGSHLGHVFDDGPAPTHARYCMNSAALRFVPASRLAAEGYGRYSALFASAAAAEPTPESTTNSCALPPPGKKAGCAATLDVVVLTGVPGTSPQGVLDVVRGHAGASPAFEVTFDPAKVTRDDVVRAYGAKSKLVADAKSFQRN